MSKMVYYFLVTLFSFSLFGQLKNKPQPPKAKPPVNKELESRSMPQDTKFIDPAWYDVLRKKIPPPPHADGSMQMGDEIEIAKWQKDRTPEICAQAKIEAEDVGLNSFFGAILNPKLNDEQKKIVSDYYLMIREEADFFIQNMKKDYNRPRPFSSMKDVTACVPTEASSSYPSGHAALSRIESLVLSEVFPAEKEKLEARALEIGRHRVQVGVHFPSDIEAGRLLADLVYEEFKKSNKYQESIRKLASDLKLKKTP